MYSPGVGRVRHPLAVTKESGTRRRPVQAKEIERQVRVQQRKPGPIRVGRGRLDARLDALRTPEVAEDFAAVRRPGVARGGVHGSNLNRVRAIGIDRDAVVREDLAEEDLPVRPGDRCPGWKRRQREERHGKERDQTHSSARQRLHVLPPSPPGIAAKKTACRHSPWPCYGQAPTTAPRCQLERCSACGRRGAPIHINADDRQL